MSKTQQHGPLGQKVSHSRSYEPGHLFAIPRSVAREDILSGKVPFHGEDIWNCYELSWLNEKGLPQVAMATIRVDAASKNITESKSVKLYLNSFNQTKFADIKAVKAAIAADIGKVVEDEVKVEIISPHGFQEIQIDEVDGVLLDNLDVSITDYEPDTSNLELEQEKVKECLYSNLLRTKCPVTDQPDWATLIIEYEGKKINHEGLLRYLVSFLEHTGFHENCVERIFMDIWQKCKPLELTVRAQFTRRGGIDINPVRSSTEAEFKNIRLFRQ